MKSIYDTKAYKLIFCHLKPIYLFMVLSGLFVTLCLLCVVGYAIITEAFALFTGHTNTGNDAWPWCGITTLILMTIVSFLIFLQMLRSYYKIIKKRDL